MDGFNDLSWMSATLDPFAQSRSDSWPVDLVNTSFIQASPGETLYCRKNQRLSKFLVLRHHHLITLTFHV